MTKQQEIREHFAKWLAMVVENGEPYDDFEGYEIPDFSEAFYALVDDFMKYLHSQGVVLKVELPELTVCEACDYYDPKSAVNACGSPEPCVDCIMWKLKAGYVATESLMEEDYDTSAEE